MPRRLRTYANLWADLSAGSGHNALTRDPAFGLEFLEEFQDKLLFGTDLCCVPMDMPLAGTLREWRDAGKISEGAFRKIARENAIRLLGLD